MRSGILDIASSPQWFLIYVKEGRIICFKVHLNFDSRRVVMLSWLLLQMVALFSRCEIVHAYYYQYNTVGENAVSLTGTEMAYSNVTSLVFKVKGCKDAILLFLSRDDKYKYRIGIENGSGTFSKITKLFFVNESIVYKVVQNDTSGEDLIECHNFKTIWLMWDNTSIMAGSGKEVMENMFMLGSDSDLIAGLNLFNIRSYGNTNLTWIFQGNDTEWGRGESTTMVTQAPTSLSWLKTTNIPTVHINDATSSINTVTQRYSSIDDVTDFLYSAGVTGSINFGNQNSEPSMTMSSSNDITTTVQTTTKTDVDAHHSSTTQILPTDEHGVTTTEITVVTENMCQCSCQKPDQNLEVRLEQIRKTLLINKTNLSLNVRKKYSAPDARVSSRYLGYLGIAVIVSVCLLILTADLTRVSKRYKK